MLKAHEADIAIIQVPLMDQRMPNIGIGYLCEALKQKGYKPLVLDLNIHFFNDLTITEKEIYKECYRELWRSEDKFEKVYIDFEDRFESYIEFLCGLQTNLLGFSVAEINLLSTLKVVREVKKRAPDKILVFGGQNYYDLKNAQELPDCVDYTIIGEGEDALPKLTEAHKKGVLCDQKIPGLYSMKASSFLPPQYVDLKTIPFPRYDEIAIKDYELAEKLIAINMARGCVANCRICLDKLMWKKYRYRQILDVISELEYHQKKNGINGFYFTDSLLNASPNLLRELCEGIIQSGLKITIVGQARIWNHPDPELFGLMAQAGIKKLEFGLESGSDRILQAMNKGITAQQAETNLKLCAEYGITSTINLIVGFPGETEEDFEETRQFVIKNASFIEKVESLHTFLLFRHTPLYNNFKAYGIKTPDRLEDWEGVDGNNIELRKRRKTSLIDSILKAGINIGYDLIGEKIEENTKTLRKIFSGFGDKNKKPRILIIRSSYVSHVKDIIGFLSEKFQDYEVSLLVQENSVDQFKDTPVKNYIIYKGSVFKLDDFLKDPISMKLRDSRLDMVVILTNYNWDSYDEVRAMGSFLKPDFLVEINESLGINFLGPGKNRACNGQRLTN